MRWIITQKMPARRIAMINIAICDDDRPFTGIVEQLLRRIADEQGLDINCEVFFDGSDIVRAVTEQQMYFDLIYLDIEMKDMDGVNTALALRAMELPALIVYISVHEERIQDLFCASPFRFLSKPIDEKKFITVFSEACVEIRKKNGYFNYSYNKVRYRIPLDRITYFESNDRIITIHLSGRDTGKIDSMENRFYGKMNEVAKQIASMNGRFLRIHQSFLVNFDYIAMLSYTSVELLDGKKLQISEDRWKDVKARFAALTDVKGG